MNFCKLETCNGKAWNNLYCEKHKYRLKKYGNFLLPSPQERFHLKYKIESNGCWIWLGGKNKSGYGIFSFSNISMMAHRYSYQIHKGEILTGMLICHSCDNRLCVNPLHLFMGTNKDNVIDMFNKKRENCRKGEKNGASKLSLSSVQEIKKLIALKKTRGLSKKYNISRATIYKIKHNILWAEVKI